MTLTPIGYGYAVSDRAAGALARGVARPLPRPGYELRVALPCGALVWLARTPLHTSPRGWTWYVDGKGAQRVTPV
jgi:hypothetical protein